MYNIVYEEASAVRGLQQTLNLVGGGFSLCNCCNT